jgi:hypothetical protein
MTIHKEFEMKGNTIFCTSVWYKENNKWILDTIRNIVIIDNESDRVTTKETLPLFEDDIYNYVKKYINPENYIND